MVCDSELVLLCVGSARGYAEWTKENAEEDRDEVFTVELHRGPRGLGLALVDGTVRPGLLLVSDPTGCVFK